MEQGQACWKRGALATDEDALGSVILLLSCQLCSSITARPAVLLACPPASPYTRMSWCCRRPCVTLTRTATFVPRVFSRSVRHKRVWAPCAEKKEIPICYAGPVQQVASKVTVVAASQARVVSEGMVRYGAVRRGMDPITQGVALSAE